MYTGIKFTNNASTQISKPLSALDTTITVSNNTAAVFPKLLDGDYCILTLVDANGQYEVVKCTSRTDSEFTVTRAQEGTVAKAFPVGSLLELRLTSGSIIKVADDASVVKVHANSNVSDVGAATAQVYGHVKVSDDFESGEQALDSTVCSPYAIQQAVTRLQGLKQELIFTTSTTWTVPETGTYKVTCVGGGGTGGTGGSSYVHVNNDDCGYGYTGIVCWSLSSGGGGGGGGAGQIIVKTLTLTKGTAITIVVGAAGGATTFGSYVTALAGYRGSNGGSPTGGAGGYSYGSTAVTGSSGVFRQGLTVGIDNVYGGAGGTGGVSLDGTYGNGGKGGTGAVVYFHDATTYTSTSGSLGAPGVQGCVKIQNVIGE